MPEPIPIQHDIVENADVCVVGSGAAGAIIASKLAQAGKNVVLVEKGGYYYTEDMNQREVDMMSLLWKNAGAMFTDDLGMAIAQGQCLGGSTVINDAVCFKTPGFVIKEWRALGVNISDADWTKALNTVYDKLSVTSATQLNMNNQKLMDACVKKGYSSSVNERNCIECKECGLCHLGCHYGTKQDMLTTYIHDALLNSFIRIYCNCSIDRVTHDGSVADGIEGTFVDKEGGERFKIRVNAKVVVIAAGAIASSALLMKSNIENTNIGKGLSFHPSSFVIAKFKDKIVGYKGIPMAYHCSEFSLLNDTRYRNEFGNKGGFMIEGIFPPVFQLALGVPPSYSRSNRSLDSLLSNIDYLAMAGVMIRDYEPSGSVCLSDKGNAKISHLLKREDLENLGKGIAELVDMWFTVGAEYVITGHNDYPVLTSENWKELIPKLKEAIIESPEALQLASAHPQGGNRMGNDPGASVVDKDRRVHGFENLFVCDASVFPTAVGVNPQITVMALAEMTADYLMSASNAFKDDLPENVGKTCSLTQSMFCSKETLGVMFRQENSKSLLNQLVNIDNSVPENDPRRWHFDSSRMTIYNNERWLGFFPEDEDGRKVWEDLTQDGDLPYKAFRLIGMFEKTFFEDRGIVRGKVTPTFLPFRLIASLAGRTGLFDLNFEAIEMDHPAFGKLVKLRYNFVPQLVRNLRIAKAYDLIKIVDKDTLIGRFEGELNLPGLKPLSFYFVLCRNYPVDFVTESDHNRLFRQHGIVPNPAEAVGRWKVRFVSDELPAFDFSKTVIIHDGNLTKVEVDTLFSEEIGAVSTKAGLAESLDFSSWQHQLRLVNRDLMLIRISPLQSASADILPESLTDLHFILRREGPACLQ